MSTSNSQRCSKCSDIFDRFRLSHHYNICKGGSKKNYKSRVHTAIKRIESNHDEVSHKTTPPSLGSSPISETKEDCYHNNDDEFLPPDMDDYDADDISFSQTMNVGVVDPSTCIPPNNQKTSPRLFLLLKTRIGRLGLNSPRSIVNMKNIYFMAHPLI